MCAQQTRTAAARTCEPSERMPGCSLWRLVVPCCYSLVSARLPCHCIKDPSFHCMFMPSQGLRGSCLFARFSKGCRVLVCLSSTALVCPLPTLLPRNGWCGSAADFCGAGCQPLYGAPCIDPSPSGSVSVTRSPSPSSTTSAAIGQSVSAVSASYTLVDTASCTLVGTVPTRYPLVVTDQHDTQSFLEQRTLTRSCSQR